MIVNFKYQTREKSIEQDIMLYDLVYLKKFFPPVFCIFFHSKIRVNNYYSLRIFIYYSPI